MLRQASLRPRPAPRPALPRAAEYCARGSLYDVLKAAPGNPALSKALDWGRRLQMALDAAKGMLHLQ